MTIYVVFGTTGEWSDRIEWPVKAFADEAKARHLVEQASAEARAIFARRKSRYAPGDNETNPYDPTMLMSYTGTSYYVVHVELEP